MSIGELVDVALGINHAQGFDLTISLHSVDVDNVTPPTVKFSDAKHHPLLVSNFLLDNSLHQVNRIPTLYPTTPSKILILALPYIHDANEVRTSENYLPQSHPI